MLKQTSVIDCLFDSFKKFAIIRQVKGLKDQGEWRIIATNSPHWCLKMIESFLLYFCCKLSAETARNGRLVSDDTLSSLFY